MKSNFLLAALSALVFAGAGCDNSIAYDYREERSEKDYQLAIKELEAGNVDKAIELLNTAIKASPGNASARFQLAIILEEKKKDYLGAYCCFAEYLRIAGDSDKSRLAREKTDRCRQMLSADKNLSNNKALNKELESAYEERAKLEKQILEYSRTHEEDTAKIQTLERKVEQLSKLTDRLKGMGDVDEDEPVSRRPVSVARMPADEGAKSAAKNTVKPVDSEPVTPPVRDNSRKELEDRENEKPLRLNPEAKALNDEEENLLKNGQSDVLPRPKVDSEGPAKVAETSASMSGFYKKPEKTEKVRDRPEYYIVKEGEGLMQIAKRFYGDKSKWKKIREANKTVVGPKGQVKAGQKLRLP